MLVSPRLVDEPVPPLATGKVPVTPVVSETLVIVFVEPEIDLFVRVSVVARPTSVSVELGIATVTVVVALAPIYVWPVAPPIVPFDSKIWPANAEPPPLPNVGELLRTNEPEPVEVVTPVPPARTGSVPAVRAELEVE